MPVYQNVEAEEINGVSVVRILDRKIQDENVDDFGKLLFALVELERKTKIVLNFEMVEILTSAAIGRLVSFRKKAVELKAVVKFCNVRPELYDLFDMTRLTKLFDIKDDEAAALASF